MSYNQGFSDIKTVIDDIHNHDSVLIYRDVGGIGDAAMITGAVTGIRRGLGKDIRIIVATIPYCSPVFYNNPDVNWLIDSTQFDRVHYDGAIDYGSGKDICKGIFESNGSMFFGLSHPCPSALYESQNEPNIQRSRQDLFSEACGVKFKVGDCAIYPTQEELLIAKKAIPFDKYTVFHVKSNAKSRDLPKYHVDNLARLLSKHTNLVLLSHDWKYRLYKYKNIVRVVRTPLREIIAIIANSEMLVGVDSMGVHLAGSLRVPVFGLFGTVNPRMRLGGYPNATWYSGYHRCKRQPCWYHPCIFGFCMRSISMKDVMESIMWFKRTWNLIKSVEDYNGNDK